jgi:hypothetical protein
LNREAPIFFVDALELETAFAWANLALLMD